MRASVNASRQELTPSPEYERVIFLCVPREWAVLRAEECLACNDLVMLRLQGKLKILRQIKSCELMLDKYNLNSFNVFIVSSETQHT